VNSTPVPTPIARRAATSSSPTASTRDSAATPATSTAVPRARVERRPQLSRAQPTTGRVSSPPTAPSAMIPPMVARLASSQARYTGSRIIEA
jgi:hypothetical protein